MKRHSLTPRRTRKHHKLIATQFAKSLRGEKTKPEVVRRSERKLRRQMWFGTMANGKPYDIFVGANGRLDFIAWEDDFTRSESAESRMGEIVGVQWKPSS